MPNQRIVIDNFIGGLAAGRFQGEIGQFDPTDGYSDGWDAYISGDEGLLRRGFGETTITNSGSVTGPVTWMKAISRTYGDYVFGVEENSTGNNRLLRFDTSTHTMSNSSPWPYTLPSTNGQCGLEFFNGYLYFASGRYLGRYNMSLSFDSSYYTFLGTSAIGRRIDHPMVQGNGKLFIGNSNFSTSTASIATDDGAAVTPNALDLAKTEQYVRSLEFYRNTLLIAGSSNAGTGSPLNIPNTMYVWDGISSSYQDKYEFPDEDFHAIKVFKNNIYGFGQRGMFVFNGSGFELVQPYSGGPDPYGVSVNPRGFISWKDEVNQAYSFGSVNSKLPTISWKPIKFSSTPSGGFFWVNRATAYVGGFSAGDPIRRFAGDSGYQTSSWMTPMFKFDQPYRLVKFEVFLQSLPSGGNLSFLWSNGDGNSPATVASLTTAGTTEWKYEPNGLVDNSWAIGISHSSGTTPKIKRIVLEVKPEQS